MSNILVVGATRGLGAALARHYASLKYKVYGTTRSDHAGSISEVEWIKNIDVAKEAAGVSIAQSLKGKTLDIVIVTAGVFGKESFDEPNFEEQTKMYTTSAIAPVFVVHYLVKAGNLKAGSKIILVSSEAGSISLRHSSEGGGNYAHHASKAALNMVGKLLSFDLAEQKIAVGLVHPGFMRTEMTKGVGYDEFWDEGGAVSPEEAAKSLAEFIDTFDIKMTGQFWAPRGPRDIGTAKATLGENLPTPLQLPW